MWRRALISRKKLPKWLRKFRKPKGSKKVFFTVKRTIHKQRRYEMPNKRMSKSQFVATLAKKSGLDKKQATSALDTINAMVAQQLSKRGPGEVLIPGLLKLSVVDKPATRQHEGVNPFTKEPMTYKAKAARKVIRVRPLKALKDAV
jgi:DNA-binding protein HU-beta